jgi:glycosyltransferase involved in cell wall biosynthesis
MKINQPKISIITVVLNAAGALEKTISSVIRQDYPHIEFIIIDGGSADGTIEVIKTHAEQIGYWVSEQDRGIYDAMNKGLAKATGEWVNFMNAGDVFFNEHVLSSVFDRDSGDAQVIYGDSIAHYPAFKTLRKAMPVEDLWKGMICCHQAMFFRTKLIQNEAYKPDVYFSADYELVLRLYRAEKKFRYIPETIAVFDTRGISNMEMVRSARSNLEILCSGHLLTRKEKRFHQKFIRQSKLTDWIYRLLPSAIINALLKLLYRDQLVHEPDQL